MSKLRELHNTWEQAEALRTLKQKKGTQLSGQPYRIGDSVAWLGGCWAAYPDDKDGDRPGPSGVTDLDYVALCVRWARHRWPGYDPVQILKAADAYEYQSCEHPGWNESRAAEVLHCIRKAAIGRLPGYDDAKWGWPEPETLSTHLVTVPAGW